MEKNNFFGEYFKALRLEAGYTTQKQLSIASGVSQTTLSRAESGQQVPLPTTLATLSKFLNVNYGELMEKAGYLSEFSSEQKLSVLDFFEGHSKLDRDINNAISSLSIPGVYPEEFSSETAIHLEAALRYFCQTHKVTFAFTPGGIRQVLNKLDPDIEFKSSLLDILIQVSKNNSYNYEAQKSGQSTTIPVIKEFLCECDLYDKRNWSEQILSPGGIVADFAIRVKGDSMLFVGIYSGDIVLLRQNTTPFDGQAVGIINSGTGDICIKYYINKKGQAYLRSANPEYKDIKLNHDHQIIGVVVGVIRETAPTLIDYDFMLSVTSSNDPRWSETIKMAESSGVSPESIQAMINMHINMISNLENAKLKKEGV
ncbi:MAG: putative prophage LambdaCh01, repressor protein [Caproiciproducens sp.]|nr:putative prophage LambdaCh01, repressor protein [Caproiciproducens sp.]